MARALGWQAGEAGEEGVEGEQERARIGRQTRQRMVGRRMSRSARGYRLALADERSMKHEISIQSTSGGAVASIHRHAPPPTRRQRSVALRNILAQRETDLPSPMSCRQPARRDDCKQHASVDVD